MLIRSGAWAEGAVEAQRAVEEAATFDLKRLGLAFSELAEIRLRQGDLDAAEALVPARELGGHTCGSATTSRARSSFVPRTKRSSGSAPNRPLQRA